MPIADEIDRILSEPKWTQERIASELGVSQSTIYRWLRGSEPDEPNREKALALYASIFEDKDANRVPLVGTVGRGQEISLSRSAKKDLVEGPPQTRSNTVAVRVGGDWMLPSFDDGWLLYYSQQLAPAEMLHHRCIVRLADGRMFIKTVRRGSKDGFWTLASYGEPEIDDVRLEWVAPHRLDPAAKATQVNILVVTDGPGPATTGTQGKTLTIVTRFCLPAECFLACETATFNPL